MKMRLYRNSLRLRLVPAEVQRLTATGSLSETTHFAPGSALVYMIELSATLDHAQALFEAGRLVVELPAADFHRWAQNDTVGIRHAQETGDGTCLEILIEKDFECIDSAMNESDVQYYPNPRKACS
jgi:hypothetical protein